MEDTSLRLTVTFVLRLMRRTRVLRTFCWEIYIVIKQVIDNENEQPHLHWQQQELAGIL